MAVIDELKAWAVLPTAPSMVIIKKDNTVEFQGQQLDHTVKRRYYNWTYTPDCLFYADRLVAVKKFGLFFVNEHYLDKVQELFTHELKQVAYVFSTDFNTFLTEEMIPGILSFNSKVRDYKIVCDELFTFIHNLNCVYEDKFFNYCKQLSIDRFGEILLKHISRQEHKDKTTRSFDGVWYYDS